MVAPPISHTGGDEMVRLAWRADRVGLAARTKGLRLIPTRATPSLTAWQRRHDLLQPGTDERRDAVRESQKPCLPRLKLGGVSTRFRHRHLHGRRARVAGRQLCERGQTHAPARQPPHGGRRPRAERSIKRGAKELGCGTSSRLARSQRFSTGPDRHCTTR